jgi:hypothetical protein
MDSLPKCLDHPLNWNKSEILAAPTAKSGLKRFAFPCGRFITPMNGGANEITWKVVMRSANFRLGQACVLCF